MDTQIAKEVLDNSGIALTDSVSTESSVIGASATAVKRVNDAVDTLSHAVPPLFQRNVGELVYSSIPLNDVNLHLLDGSVLDVNGTYKTGIAYILSLKINNASLFCSESDWQTSVTNYGVCGKFVHDTTNGTLRLPKVSGFVEGTLDVTKLGDLVEAGLPNITGVCGNPTGGADYSGAFYKTAASYSGATAQDQFSATVNFNASRSSSIYGNSTTVQPQAIKQYIYIVLGNITATGKAAVAHAAMPSGQYIDYNVTLEQIKGVQYNFTAPEDGYLLIVVRNPHDNIDFVGVYDDPLYYHCEYWAPPGGAPTMLLPMSKGRTVIVRGGSTLTALETFRFIYCNGSAPTV